MQLHKLRWVGIAGGLVVWRFIDAQKLSQTNTFVVRVENVKFIFGLYAIFWCFIPEIWYR